MHKLLILDPHKGHIEFPFAPPEVEGSEAEDSRAQAKVIFDEVMARPTGWTWIAQKPEAVEGTTLKAFDPNVEEAIAVAPVVGG